MMREFGRLYRLPEVPHVCRSIFWQINWSGKGTLTHHYSEGGHLYTATRCGH